MRSEHPFNATTSGPARPGVTRRTERDTCKRRIGAGMGPSPAALTVEQPGRRERVADPARQRVEPLIVEVHNGAPERASRDRSAPAFAAAVKHVAEADNHPPLNW